MLLQKLRHSEQNLKLIAAQFHRDFLSTNIFAEDYSRRIFNDQELYDDFEYKCVLINLSLVVSWKFISTAQ